MRKFRVVLLLAAVMSLASAGASAGTIIGGSALLDAARLTQLEAWLGEGPLVVTNIFTGISGDGKTAPTFHAAANGQGRTFVLYQVTSPVSAIIGGYNPQSWNSSGTYNLTPKGLFVQPHIRGAPEAAGGQSRSHLWPVSDLQ